MANSTNVADGQDTLAAQYNNLRLDVLDPTTGHDHDGTASHGKKVDHGDLNDTALAHLTHATLNKHVQGTGTASDPDAGGGDRGVHGLDADIRVVGAVGSQMVLQAGTVTVSADSGSVTFTTPFTTLVGVWIQWVETVPDMDDRDVAVTAQSVSGFSWECAYRPDSFNWLAIGTL